jgi:predicted nucleotidyltransferase
MRLKDPLDNLFQNRSHVKVLRALDQLPTGIDVSIREIARRSGVSHPTASTVLEGLRQQGVVRARRTLLAAEYRLNEDHVVAQQLASLFRWEESSLHAVLDFLAEEIPHRASWVDEAYLFGSAVRDDMRPDSDLDVALISSSRRAGKLHDLMDELSDLSASKFGNRIQATIGTRPITELAQPGQRSYRLWRTIKLEGVRFLPIEAG